MAKLFLHDLIVEGKHGVLPHEKEQAQTFRINLELTYDASASQTSDEITDAVDYAAVRQTVIDIVTEHSYNLLERLAKVIADTLLEDQRLTTVTIRIDKPTIFDDVVPGVALTIER